MAPTAGGRRGQVVGRNACVRPIGSLPVGFVVLGYGGGEPKEFEYPYTQLTDVAGQLNEADIPFEVDPPNNGFWFTLIGTLAPILLIILFFILFMSSMQGGGNRVMSFGKSRARRMTKDQPKVTFADVAGADEAVQELTEIKEFLE